MKIATIVRRVKTVIRKREADQRVARTRRRRRKLKVVMRKIHNAQRIRRRESIQKRVAIVLNQTMIAVAIKSLTRKIRAVNVAKMIKIAAVIKRARRTRAVNAMKMMKIAVVTNTLRADSTMMTVHVKMMKTVLVKMISRKAKS